MATPNKPTIYVVPATEDDYDQLVEWTHAILCRGDPVLDRIFPYPERASEDIPQTLKAFTDPSGKTFKAVFVGSKGEGDRMVGYVHIVVQGESWVEEEIAEGERNGEQPPPNRADPKAFIQFFTKLNQARYHYVGGKPHLLVHWLCVNTPDQRMGAGTALMRFVMQLARDANIPIYLEATQQGAFLYDRLGFEVVETLYLDLPDGGTVSLPIMTKSPLTMNDL